MKEPGPSPESLENRAAVNKIALAVSLRFGVSSIAVREVIAPLLDEAVREERAKRLEVQAVLREYAEWMGPGCQEGCPADDTCNCAFGKLAARVTAAVREV